MKNLSRSLLALALLAAAPTASAGGFSTTNVQLLQGYGFDNIIDTAFAGVLDEGNKTTLTLNHFSTWEMGDSFFFVDLARGDIGGNDWVDAYAEWHPRLFLNTLLGQKEPALGLIRNWGLAGELNQGVGFYAYLAGVGFDFVAPPGWVLGLNLYYRYDNFGQHGWQLSPFWTVPFSVGAVPFVFTGFLDLNKAEDLADENGFEIMAQPQLLVDVLAPFGGAKGKLLVGTELYIHTIQAGATDETNVVPQIMAQWTIF